MGSGRLLPVDWAKTWPVTSIGNYLNNGKIVSRRTQDTASVGLADGDFAEITSSIFSSSCARLNLLIPFDLVQTNRHGREPPA
jgi:hypothetical protein